MNKEQRLPQAQDWNAYWGLDKTQRFTQISWSKRRIMKVCQPFLIQGHAALDAGCGSGFFSKFFLDQGLQTMALDYSEEALNVAKEKTSGQVKTIQADLTKEGLACTIQNRFDVIFTDGLFEHFEDPVQDIIMRNLSSVLNPNGVIITFVPNKWSPWELIRPFFMPGIEEDPFVMSGLRNLNERNELKIISDGGVNTFPFALSPDAWVGKIFGMLLFTIAKKNKSSNG